MYTSKIIIQTKDENISDIIQSDKIIKKGEKYSFFKNSSFDRSNYISLNSDEFYYDAITGIITNTIDYNGTYYENIIRGNSIYFDSLKNNFKSKNVHFEIISENNLGIL